MTDLLTLCPDQSGRFLDPPAGATAGLSPYRRSPAVPRRFGSRVPHGTTRLTRLTRLTRIRWPASIHPGHIQPTLQDHQRRIVIAVQDPPTARADMRPYAERLLDARRTGRPVGQDAAAVLARVRRWHGHHRDAMELAVI